MSEVQRLFCFEKREKFPAGGPWTIADYSGTFTNVTEAGDHLLWLTRAHRHWDFRIVEWLFASKV